jgi:acyl-CoA thioester hydrolase
LDTTDNTKIKLFPALISPNNDGLDDLLTIQTVIPEIPGVKIRFEYQVSNEAGEQIARGWTTLAFLRKENHQPTRPPKDLLELLRPYFN